MTTEYQVWILRRGGFGWQVYAYEPTISAAREAILRFERDVCGLVDWRIVSVYTVARMAP